MFDILITGGNVIDGTGAEPTVADIGIRGDKIAETGDLSGADAPLRINAADRLVCPGFIDAHSHSSAYLLIEPSASSKIFQGITTEVVGNCGASAAPLTGQYLMPSDWTEMEYPDKWSSVAEYRELLEQVRPAPNVFFLAGHKALRTGVLGYEHRPASQDEISRMRRALEKAMDEGARGFSTGLIYAPAMYAEHAEISALAKTAAEREGIYTTHMRSEGDRLIESIEETLRVCGEGVRTQISHLKVAGKSNWHKIDEALRVINKARADGLDIAADRYPYTSSCTELDVIFPDWAEEGGPAEITARLKDPALRKKIGKHIRESRPDDYWETITIGSTWHPDCARFTGMPLVKAAAELKMDPVDAVLYLVEKGEAKTTALFFGMNEENMMRILAEPYVMIGTDASLRVPGSVLSRDCPHPRGYGSFTRFLKMALDEKTVPLPEAVRKMTALPAEQFRLKDRGTIAKNRKADICVINPVTLKENSTITDPHRLSSGLDFLAVNGEPVVADGKLTGRRAGKWL